MISENGTSWTKIEDGGIVPTVKTDLGMTDFNIQAPFVRRASRTTSDDSHRAHERAASRKVGNEPMQSQFVEAWSKFVGSGKHEASFTKALPVSKTTEVQAMVEEMNSPIGLSTGWKSVTVDCTGAGGGGFAGTPNTSNPDAQPKLPVPPPGVIVGGAVDLMGKPNPTERTVCAEPDLAGKNCTVAHG